MPSNPLTQLEASLEDLSKRELIKLVYHYRKVIESYEDEIKRLSLINEKLGYTKRVIETHGVLVVN